MLRLRALRKVKTMPPPMMILSHFPISDSMTPILEDTLDPPTMAAKGLLGCTGPCVTPLGVWLHLHTCALQTSSSTLYACTLRTSTTNIKTWRTAYTGSGRLPSGERLREDSEVGRQGRGYWVYGRVDRRGEGAWGQSWRGR